MSNSFIDDLSDIPGLNDLTRKSPRLGLHIADEVGDELPADEDLANAKSKEARPTFPCESCGGTGRYRGVRVHQPAVECFACKGKGFYYTSFKDRTDKRAKAKANKQAKAAAAADSYAAEHPAVIAWLKDKAAAGKFAFAVSVHSALLKYGHLTDNQLAACERFMAKDAEFAAARVAKAAEVAKTTETANSILTAAAVDNLMASLKQASAKGLKKPALRFEGFTVTMAGANSKNAGGLYLKDGPVYLGKIVDGKLTASWEANRMEGLLDRIATAMVDPVEAARAYGKRTGRCSCCGRPLTDPVSVEKGIGPICEATYF
jgi:hypothetical protein